MNEQVKKCIGTNLRNIRKSNLLNVDEVAESSGISKDTIYRLEQGRSDSLKTLLKLLDHYGVHYNIFFKQIYDKCHNE